MAVHGIAWMLRKERLNLVFLFKTRKSVTEMEVVRCKLGFSNMLAMSSCGRRRGVSCLWNEEVNVRIESYSIEHINVIFDNGWRCTGFNDAGVLVLVSSITDHMPLLMCSTQDMGSQGASRLFRFQNFWWRILHV
ncbi:hypothetical protein ACFE04_016137 [Oxalis oulophora]